jgi:threonine dehydrogenase-like Zn-dependent dehydrogenase
VPRPEPGVGDALIKVTLTTICGTDVHILKGEYPVREGLIVGHEPVGVIEALGPGVTGYASAIGSSSEPSRLAGSAVRACPARRRSVGTADQGTRPSAAGASATRSTAARPSTCWCRTRRPTWRRSPTG